MLAAVELEINIPLRERQFLVDRVDFLLFHLIDFADVGAENLAQALIVETMQAVIWGCWEAASLLVAAAAPGSKR